MRSANARPGAPCTARTRRPVARPDARSRGWLAILMAACAVTAFALPVRVAADAQAAVDGCVRQVRKTGGPDAQNGITVVSQDWSQAGTLVTLRDAGGTVWKCVGYDDGSIGDLSIVDAADDGASAMAGSDARAAAAKGVTTTRTVHFAKGASSAIYEGTLTPGSSTRYVLSAKNGQFLTAIVDPEGAGVSYQIFNPDRSFLLDMIGADKPYRGQLWQSGKHVIEVINRSNRSIPYNIELTVK